MKFRPCIDIHNGKVKQIVGGSLKDYDNALEENFVSSQDASFYANLYKQANLKGGHIILLNKPDTPEYEYDCIQAELALRTYEGGLQVGGGITPYNAKAFLQMGASHVIVTSYVFQDGVIQYDHLKKLEKEVGKEHIVLDLSCRKKGNEYYVVTNRWQTFTKEIITYDLLNQLSGYCDEFLVHAVDVEGKVSGIETELVKKLASFQTRPITYAGGVSCYDDLHQLRKLSNNTMDVTIGSALDLFGGPLKFLKVLNLCDNEAMEEGKIENK